MLGTRNRAEIFVLTLVYEEFLMLIMATNTCSLKLLHVCVTIMSCKETKNLIFSEEQLFPSWNCQQLKFLRLLHTHIHECDLKVFLPVDLQCIGPLLQACSNVHVVCYVLYVSKYYFIS